MKMQKTARLTFMALGLSFFTLSTPAAIIKFGGYFNVGSFWMAGWVGSANTSIFDVASFTKMGIQANFYGPAYDRNTIWFFAPIPNRPSYIGWFMSGNPTTGTHHVKGKHRFQKAIGSTIEWQSHYQTSVH